MKPYPRSACFYIHTASGGDTGRHLAPCTYLRRTNLYLLASNQNIRRAWLSDRLDVLPPKRIKYHPTPDQACEHPEPYELCTKPVGTTGGVGALHFKLQVGCDTTCCGIRLGGRNVWGKTGKMKHIPSDDKGYGDTRGISPFVVITLGSMLLFLCKVWLVYGRWNACPRLSAKTGFLLEFCVIDPIGDLSKVCIWVLHELIFGP